MKAKVKETGEIVEINPYVFDENAIERHLDELKLESGWNIDWEQRKFELVKAAIQGLSGNPQEDVVKANDNLMATWAINLADAVIKKLKEG